jgi:hypothetical protein
MRKLSTLHDAVLRPGFYDPRWAERKLVQAKTVVQGQGLKHFRLTRSQRRRLGSANT